MDSCGKCGRYRVGYSVVKKKRAGAVVAGHGREESILSCSSRCDYACVKRRGLDWTHPASSLGPNHCVIVAWNMVWTRRGATVQLKASQVAFVKWYSGCKGGGGEDKKEGRSPTRRDNAAPLCVYMSVDYYLSQFSRNIRSTRCRERRCRDFFISLLKFYFRL